MLPICLLLSKHCCCWSVLSAHTLTVQPLPAPCALQYRSATKIMEKFDCNLLVVTSRHVILCQERRLQLYNLLGTKEREWLMDSTIRWAAGEQAAWSNHSWLCVL